MCIFSTKRYQGILKKYMNQIVVLLRLGWIKIELDCLRQVVCLADKTVYCVIITGYAL